MIAFLLEFFYMEIIIMGAIIITSLYIFERVVKSAERASDREHEIRKLQIQEKLHLSNPSLFAELDRLQRQFSLIAMGIRGGWIPFVLMFLHTMTRTSITLDGETQTLNAWIPPVAIIIGLVVFYAFLFNRAFSITAKMKETEAEILIKTPKNEG